jgi:uncharacterized damage-inducible protein DinB
MSSQLLDVFRHSAWANRELLDFCGKLTPDQTKAGLPGGYGSVLATLKHIAGAEAYYRSLFTGAFPDWDWQDGVEQPVEQMLPWFVDMASFWEDLLSGGFDPDQVLETRSSRLNPGVLLTQALHHGNVHREQVSAVLTSLGLTPPDVSGWAYGRASGDIVPK